MTNHRPRGEAPRLFFGVAAFGLALALAAVGPGAVAAQAPPERAAGPVIDGVSLVAPRGRAAPEAMRAAREVGADWVAVVPYAFLRPESGEVVFDRAGQFRGERTEGIREQVALARENGLRILFKSHVWTRGQWIGDYVPADGEAWRRWIRGYRAYALHMARLAEELDVEMMAVGTELKEVVRRRPGWMRELISDVRRVYRGELTYAANWDAYADVPFWDALDYIGIDAYFPLTPESVPDVETLNREWQDELRALEALAARHRRPILFAEFGYRSVEGAAGPHWELPSQRSARPSVGGRTSQARAYEALFRTWWDRPWFAGGFLWKWFLDDGGGRRARYRATGYTPQGKPALEVIRRWYGEDEGRGDGSSLPEDHLQEPG